jgi:hypothetical protein
MHKIEAGQEPRQPRSAEASTFSLSTKKEGILIDRKSNRAKLSRSNKKIFIALGSIIVFYYAGIKATARQSPNRCSATVMNLVRIAEKYGVQSSKLQHNLPVKGTIRSNIQP